MKRIITILFFVASFEVFSQTLTHSVSQVITDLNSVACEQALPPDDTKVISENTFYRSFKLSDFSITSDYTVTSVTYGIERLSGAPAAGYPITVKIYTSSSKNFPSGSLNLIAEVTEMVQNQSLQLHTTPISASIPAGSEIVVAIYVPSDAPSDGGNGQVSFQIGSNASGETAPSYLKAVDCGLTQPVTFTSQGHPEVQIVMSVQGSGQTAGNEDLALFNFRYFPNPVKEKIYLDAKEEIAKVLIFNVMGQEITTYTPNDNKTEIDLTFLTSGTYFVKAEVADKSGIFKIVKI